MAPTYFKIWIRHWIVGINCSKNPLVWAVFSETDKLYWANAVTDHRNNAHFSKTPKPLITFKCFKSQVYFNCRFSFLNKMFSHWHGHSAFIVTVRDFVGEFRLFLFCGILGYTITNTTLTLKHEYQCSGNFNDAQDKEIEVYVSCQVSNVQVDSKIHQGVHEPERRRYLGVTLMLRFSARGVHLLMVLQGKALIL